MNVLREKTIPLVRVPSRGLVVMLAALSVVGCDAPEARFRMNMAFVDKQQREAGSDFAAAQVQDVADILTGMFGTPDDPYIPRGGSSGIDQLFDDEAERKIRMAAGAVSSDDQGNPQGLYRQHCAHCHGITGDGAGPTAAFLNPYPRDYRMGVYKFKSTPRGRRPTHEDLRRILVEGIPGTAMPSFRLLDEDEIDALVQYVKYLSIRGEVERTLVREMALEFVDEKDRLDKSPDFLLDDVLARVVGGWLQAESSMTPIAEPAVVSEEELLASIARGRELYFGPVANCVKCHGDTQLGDGQTNDYDDWSKDFFDWTSETDETVKKRMADQLVALGGLRPRNIKPRNMRQGIYRGGRRPIDLYRRIHDGIDGTPMPASLMIPEGAPPETKGLTPEDIWHLVRFVQSLPYHTLSQPGQHVPTPTYQRERM